MSDTILVDVDLEPAKNTASMKQRANLQHCDTSEGKDYSQIFVQNIVILTLWRNLDNTFVLFLYKMWELDTF